MATVHARPVQHLVLSGIDWRTYTRLLRALDERPAIRLTYDCGVLEIMSLSHRHESPVHLLGRLVEALTEELGLPIKGGRSTTLRRRRTRRGLEPDESYWIAHEPLVRGKDFIDLRTDPPPDLAIEVDVTSSSLDRMAIYASLGVLEVWRFEQGSLTFHHLATGGRYVASDTSRAFPQLKAADLGSFLALRTQMEENAILRQFRTWVRQQITAGGSAPPLP